MYCCHLKSITIHCQIVEGPPLPLRSIAHYMGELSNFVVRDVKEEKVGSDGMYKNHMIVMTRAPAAKKEGRKKKWRRRFLREEEDGVDAGIALGGGGSSGFECSSTER